MKYKIHILLLIFLLSCNSLQDGNDLQSKSDLVELVNSIECKSIDFNKLIEDSMNFTCYQLRLFNEPCLSKVINEDIIRVAKITPSASALFFRIQKVKENCLIRIRKEIPPETFGLHSYLIEDRDIKYNVSKGIAKDLEFDNIAMEIEKLGKSNFNQLAINTLYSFEVITNGNYNKVTFSEDELKKRDLTFYNQVQSMIVE